MSAPNESKRRGWLTDLCFVSLAYAAAFLALLDNDAARPADLAVAVLVPPMLLGRRRWPVTVATVALIGFVISPAAGAAAAIAALTVRGLSPAMSFTIAGASLVAVIATVVVRGPITPYRPLLGLLVLALAVEVILFVRLRGQLARAAREREQRRTTEAEQKIETARVNERLRIGREIHDALGHRLTLLNLHASALAFRTDATAEEISGGIDVIQRSSAAALVDLQEAIGVLCGPDEAPATQRPSLAALPQLVDEARADGTVIEAALPESDQPVRDTTAERTVYRIVQEALTNARRHAPGATVSLRVRHRQGAIDVRVENALAPGPSTRSGSGTGMIGIEERVALADGTLHYGPTAEGRFVVEASIPFAT